MRPVYYPELANAALTYPAIDNHAHPLLANRNRNAFPLEGIISEANGEALTHDARYTLASYRATAQLSKLFGSKGGELTWEALQSRRDEADYVDLCNMCFKPTGIQCILLDDGLGGVADFAEPYQWHDQFTTSPSKRIVRIETEAEVCYRLCVDPYLLIHSCPKNILRKLLNSDSSQVSTSIVSVIGIFGELVDRFKASILTNALDDHVAGFKSVVCYR